MITPFKSQAIGLAVSVLLGIVVYLCSSWFFKETLDFWNLGEILSYLAGIPLGVSAAYATFTSCLREVPISSVGILKILGSLTKDCISQGTHWVPPFVEVLTVPGETEKFIIPVPGEKIETKDGSAVHFGTTENGGKENQLQYSITDPQLYIVVEDPEKSICEAYMEAARLFFGQASEAAGVRNEGKLFPEFIMLSGLDTAFESRLRNAEFLDGNGTKKPIFEKDAADAIVREVGTFIARTTAWGIGNITIFTPNVRENPAAQEAAEKRQVAEENAAALTVKVEAIKKHTAEMGAMKVTPDFALASLMKMSGEDVEIIYRNVPEFMGLSGAVHSSAANHQRKGAQHGNSNSRKGQNRPGGTKTPKP